MATKTLELYLYNNEYYEAKVSSKQPYRDDEGNFQNSGSGVAISICDDGLALFGLKKLDNGVIYRVTLSIDAVEIGEPKTVVDYKPFAPSARQSPPRKKRRR